MDSMNKKRIAELLDTNVAQVDQILADTSTAYLEEYFTPFLSTQMRAASNDQAKLEELRKLLDLFLGEGGGNRAYLDTTGSIETITSGYDNDEDESSDLFETEQQVARQKQARIIMYGVLGLLAFLILPRIFGGGGVESVPDDEIASDVLGVISTTVTIEATILPTIPLNSTEFDEVFDELGDSGGAAIINQLNRPSQMVIKFLDESTSSYPIDPIDVSPQLEVVYDLQDLEGDTPEVNWLSGRYVNYVFGVPSSVLSKLEDGFDGTSIAIEFNTGVQMNFVVNNLLTIDSSEADKFLSQNRVGITLFELPGSSNSDLRVVTGSFVLNESSLQQIVSMTDELNFDGVNMELDSVQVNEISSSKVRVDIQGSASSSTPQDLFVNLSDSVYGQSQTEILRTVTDSTVWNMSFEMPSNAENMSMSIRTVDSSALILLDEITPLRNNLTVSQSTFWDTEREEVVLVMDITNASSGNVFIDNQFIVIDKEALLSKPIRFDQKIPVVVPGGESVEVTIFISPPVSPIGDYIGFDLTINDTLWSIPDAILNLNKVEN